MNTIRAEEFYKNVNNMQHVELLTMYININYIITLALCRSVGVSSGR